MKRFRVHLTRGERAWAIVTANITALLLVVELLVKGHP